MCFYLNSKRVIIPLAIRNKSNRGPLSSVMCTYRRTFAYLGTGPRSTHSFPNLMHTPLSHHRLSLPSRWLGAAALVTTLALAACGPSDLGASKLKGLPKGASRTSVLAAMGTGPLAPNGPNQQARIVNGFRHQVYLNLKDGGTYEFLWYREEPGTVEDPIVKKRETPVVIVADTLVGWGWKFFSEYAKKERLPDPSQDQARLDSIYKAQNPDSLVKMNAAKEAAAKAAAVKK